MEHEIHFYIYFSHGIDRVKEGSGRIKLNNCTSLIYKTFPFITVRNRKELRGLSRYLES